MKTNNMIAINGKHYDAVTGVAIEVGAQSAKLQSKAIDGVLRPSLADTKTHPGSGNPPAHHHSIKTKAVHHTRPLVNQPTKRHKLVASKTLMRQVVKKPSHPILVSGLRVQGRTDSQLPDINLAVMPKLSFDIIDGRRQARAKKIAKSRFISRFGDVTLPTSIQLAPLPAPAHRLPESTTLTLPAADLKSPPLGHQRSMDIFQQALVKASKQQPPQLASKRHKRVITKRPSASRRHRLASVSTTALAVILLAGFLAYQNIPNISVRLASTHAGFNANLPNYRPAGFSIGKFAYSPGHVSINFHSNSDGRHFALLENSSNWDSATLLNDYVAQKSKTYQTVMTAGRTVYIYGQNNATWVADGIWYRVDSQNALSSTQLIDLAASI